MTTRASPPDAPPSPRPCGNLDHGAARISARRVFAREGQGIEVMNRFRFALAPAVAVAMCLASSGPSKPVTTRAADHVKDLFDDYFQGTERVRFFAAAGVDGELSKEEFAAARGKRDSFVRGFDRWEAAFAHDKNSNGRLSWPEAEEYRLAVCGRILAEFDADEDGELTGAERDAANRRLGGTRRAAAGKAASRPRVASADGPVRRAGGLRQYDKDGDGELSHAERKEMIAAIRTRVERYRRRWQIHRYDTNKDGRLDEAERVAMAKAQAEAKARVAEYLRERRKEMAEGNRLDEAARAEAEKARAARKARWEMTRREMDADKDGEVSGRERREYWERIRKQYDADGDGKLNSRERAKMMKDKFGF